MTLDLRTIDWKDGDSRTEMSKAQEKFIKDFVSIADISMLQEEHHLFIWGARGMGKTAFAWNHLRTSSAELHIELDFEAAEDWVNAIIERITRLASLEGFPVTKLLEDAWYNNILTETMRRLIAHDKITTQHSTISRYLRSLDKKRNILQDVFRSIESIEERLALNSGIIVDPITSVLKLTGKGLLLLEDFYQRKSGFPEALDALCDNLRPIRRRSILIVVDSVDKFLMPVSFPEAPKEHRSLCLIVRGLCRALLRLHNDTRFASAFEVKMFLPLDMKDSIKDRSYEHELIYHHNLQWTADELAVFISKQLNSHNFDESQPHQLVQETWDALFPFQIDNAITNVKHRSIDYLLRHTQYRPRQLLFCLRAMSEEARKKNTPTLSPQQFSTTIHEYCREACGRIINEFKAGYPKIYEIVHRFERDSNILKIEDIYNLISGLHFDNPASNSSNHQDEHDIHWLIQFLYEIGFLGVIKDEEHVKELGICPPFTTVNNKTYYFIYNYIHPRFSVSQEKLFAIHPMFYSRFNFNIDKTITVAQHANFQKVYPRVIS